MMSLNTSQPTPTFLGPAAARQICSAARAALVPNRSRPANPDATLVLPKSKRALLSVGPALKTSASPRPSAAESPAVGPKSSTAPDDTSVLPQGDSGRCNRGSPISPGHAESPMRIAFSYQSRSPLELTP